MVLAAGRAPDALGIQGDGGSVSIAELRGVVEAALVRAGGSAADGEDLGQNAVVGMVLRGGGGR